MNRNNEIVRRYVLGESAEELGTVYNISDRQVQRIVQASGKSRTQSESYRLAIKRGRMVYYKKPEHLKKKRKTVQGKLRYAVLERDNHTCQSCGNRVSDGVRLEIDHIDENATNNVITNLQVLCNLCNSAKSWLI